MQRNLSGMLVGLALLAALPLASQPSSPLPPFDEVSPPPAPDYADPASWSALPDRADFADYTPEGLEDRQAEAEADVFFIHPTTFLTGESWNAAIDHEVAAPRLDQLVTKHQASVFNGCCRIFVPRYRQAGITAFMAREEEGRRAMALAYEDVRRAFDHYLEHWNGDRPFLIASHSQGSRYALWLLQDVVDRDPALLERFVAAYIVGYAIPVDVYDRTLAKIDRCRSISDVRCVLNWSTYQEGASAQRSREVITHRYPAPGGASGFVWEANAGKELQCTNPLAWTEGPTPEWAPASLSRGALRGAPGEAELPAPVKGEIAARCHDEVLYVRVPEESFFADRHRSGNYHNLDYNLFYVDIRHNAAARVEAFVRGAHRGQVIDPSRILPATPFEEMPQPAPPDYSSPIAWAALPWRLDFADFAPQGSEDRQAEAKADVFFLYPTTFLFDEGWNSPIDHAVASARVDQGVLKHQASVFNGCCRIFAPRYRQATLVSFLPPGGASARPALDLAYGDVKRAFEVYLEHYNEGRPFILASHSQGTRHLIELLGDVVARHPARSRMVAAYAIGFPLPLSKYDGPYGEIEPCRAADDTGCVVSYGTWGEGGPRPPGRSGNLQCSNPLDWSASGEKAEASRNEGSLVGAPLHEPLPPPVPGLIGAQCRDGVLWADVPEGSYFFELRRRPNNYHNLDYSLFYMNLRSNARLRVESWLRRR